MPKIIEKIAVILIGITILMTAANADNQTSRSHMIVFVSFSMPKESIKGWMNEAKRIHAPVVIRGLVNNSFKETISKLNELMYDNHGGVQLDPALFITYQIKKVPAVVIREGNQYDVVYGDAHLDYALKMIMKRSDGLSPFAEAALQTLRGG